MKIYPYVDKTRANKDGSFSVYFIVSNSQGRFFVNTGLTTCDKLVNMSFPKSDAGWRHKTALLGKYFAAVTSLCLEWDIAKQSNQKLKERVLNDVFGIKRKIKPLTLSDVIQKFADTKREQTAVLYRITARKVEAFDQKAGLSVNRDWLQSFYDYCINSGMKINGAGKELRNIRAVFNWARRKGMTTNYPFLDYHIREEETVPNNLSVYDLRRLRDYPCEPWQKPYVDFFFLSFYLAGINPVDLLSLKAGCVKDGHLSFVRKKTNKEGVAKVRTITLPVLPEAQKIIDRYPSREGWLVSFMDCRNDYHSFAKQANEALQKVGRSWKVKDKVGKLRKMEYEPICPGITLYSARYSFGSIAANDLDISEQTIARCLGHAWSKQVTARYIANDQRKIDNAVKRVVDYVVKGG